jgi:predicted nuclease with TOPRIM domain
MADATVWWDRLLILLTGGAAAGFAKFVQWFIQRQDIRRTSDADVRIKLRDDLVQENDRLRKRLADVEQMLEPLRAKLQQAENELTECQRELEIAKGHAAALEMTLARLQSELAVMEKRRRQRRPEGE